MTNSTQESGLRDADAAVLTTLRREFERALNGDLSPRIEDYLSRVGEQLRPTALFELLKLEIGARRGRQETVNSNEYVVRFPAYESAILRAWDQGDGLATQAHENENLQFELNNNTSPRRRSASEAARTIDHTPSRKDSRGLHIRCPHCSNPVELLADTPYAEVSCDSCGSMFSLVDRDDASQMATPLKTIDRFDLVARLGIGGFGTVWKARDRDLQRLVAVKIPRRGQLSPEEIEQFYREARSAAQLRHPNIVPVHEVGREGDTFFIVSDFIRGVTLVDWLTANRTTPREAVELCIPITEALHHAHQQRVIHRDLKPSNIMIGENGEPYLMDFGLAKREVGEITMTMDGQVIGTPRYMSPEQAGGQGHLTDRRSDIYSLGVMLFEMCTGEAPFRGNAQMQINQRLTEDAPDPRKLNRHLPRDLATICLKCLEREPGRRYSTAAELGDEFKRFVRGEPILARPISAPARLVRWAKRKPMIATTAALTIFLAIGGPVVALLIERQRVRLEQLLTEKNNLIDRYGSDKSSAANQITDLNKQLAVWEGKANPWEFWPPKREEAPRQQVATKLLDHSRATLLNQLNAGTYNGAQKARGYLGLAVLADTAGNKSEAKSYYGKARGILNEIRQKTPDDPRYNRAIAECDLHLARLGLNDDRDAAKKDLQSARDIYQKLAEEHKADSIKQIEWLEAELFSATTLGFDSGQENLLRAAEISKTLQSKLPGDPDKVYRLSCYLFGRDPFLVEPTTASTD